MASSAPLIVKITNTNANGTEIRRFTSNRANLSWSAVSKKAAELFDFQAASSLKLTYVDDEGDRITLSSDDELTEAIGLALKASPAILRLNILGGAAVAAGPAAGAAEEDAPMAQATVGDASTMTDSKNPAEASRKPTGGPKPSARSPSPPDVARDVGRFIRTLSEQLPGLVEQLPPDVRRILPHAELDLPATIMANAASHAATFAGAAAEAAAAASAAASASASASAAASASASASASHGEQVTKGGEDDETAAATASDGIHFGVTCDRSGVCPIVGYRYNLVGHNYDLCHAEYVKLPAKERALYQRIPPPFVHKMNGGAAPPPAEGGTPATTHYGVECDRSGMCPIVGNRYHLRGHNYDLCQAEFDKLPATEKLLYTLVPPPPTATQPPQSSAHPWRQCGPWAAATATAATAATASARSWRRASCATSRSSMAPRWRRRHPSPRSGASRIRARCPGRRARACSSWAATRCRAR